MLFIEWPLKTPPNLICILPLTDSLLPLRHPLRVKERKGTGCCCILYLYVFVSFCIISLQTAWMEIGCFQDGFLPFNLPNFKKHKRLWDRVVAAEKRSLEAESQRGTGLSKRQSTCWQKTINMMSCMVTQCQYLVMLVSWQRSCCQGFYSLSILLQRTQIVDNLHTQTTEKVVCCQMKRSLSWPKQNEVVQAAGLCMHLSHCTNTAPPDFTR